MNDLQRITNAWGNWKAGQLGTQMIFTASTNYSDYSELDDFHSNQVTSTANPIIFATAPRPVDETIALYSQDFTNTDQHPKTYRFTCNKTIHQPFTWKISQFADIGISVTAVDGPPSVMTTPQPDIIELCLTEQNEKSIEISEDWSVDDPVYVPPEETIRCSLYLTIQTYTVDFTQPMILGNQVAIWFHNAVDLLNPGGDDKHWLWFVPINQVFQDVINNNLTPMDDFSIIDDIAYVTAAGTFVGKQGVSPRVTQEQINSDP